MAKKNLHEYTRGSRDKYEVWLSIERFKQKVASFCPGLDKR